MAAAAALLLHAATTHAQWQAMTPKASCRGLSFTDDGEAYMVRTSSIYTKLHRLVGGAWDAGINANVGFMAAVNKVHFLDKNTGFIAVNDNKIYRTADGGKTWTGVAIKFKKTGIKTDIRDLDFGTKTHGVAVGTHGDYVKKAPFVALTTDGGKTWNEVASGPFTGALLVGMAGSKTIVTGAYTSSTLWLSHDAGKTWSSRKVYGKGILDIGFISDKTGFVLSFPLGAATTNEQVLVTGDGGKTWKSNSTKTLPLQAQIMGWVDDKNGYVGGRTADNKSLALARTKDAGKSWKVETLPADPQFSQASDIMYCLEYPGPAAYAGTTNGKVSLLVNKTAGGKRAPRYGAVPPPADAGVPPVDAGAPADAGLPADVGAPADVGMKYDAIVFPDFGPGSPDAGSTPPEAGSPPADKGAADLTPGAEGMLLPDNGSPGAEAGAADGGSTADAGGTGGGDDDSGSCSVGATRAADLTGLALLLLAFAWLRRRRA